jgi:hypothetical protein
MTATWSESVPRDAPSACPAGRGGLRLVRDGGDALPYGGDDRSAAERWGSSLAAVPDRRAMGRGRRHASPQVRRRRALLGVIGLLLMALALPLSGTGGHSHAIGSALAETGGPVVYTVQPGDTLWSIAERVNPTADPRPLMARLASQTGSDSVVPGERVVLP